MPLSWDYSEALIWDLMTSYRFLTLLATLTIAPLCNSVRAGDLPPPLINTISATNSEKRINWAPYPASEQYKILRSDDLLQPWVEDKSGTISGFDWVSPWAGSPGFYRLQVMPMDTNALLVSTVLNRLAYGPTPDELARVAGIGPQAYIDEQMTPETIADDLPFETITTNFGSGWQQFTASGNANTSGTGTNFYLYLNVPGDCFIDDIRVVAGSVAGVGLNLIRNGDFESPLDTNDWVVSPNHAASAITGDVSHSGAASLHMRASVGGTTQGSAIWQHVIGLTNGARYTLSYWFLPSTNNQLSSLTVRFSSSWMTSAPYSVSSYTKLLYDSASIDDLRAWHVLRAVESRRQLLEVLDQFLENHFVTQYSKSRDYFDTFYNDGNLLGQLAAQLEFKENQRWRQALLNPQCSFYDLLKISAESPAMIIYLDTVSSRGDGGNVANENYARELLELFDFGVDNGYDQTDITVMSRCWTGWRLELVDAINEFNPFAAKTQNRVPGALNGAYTNLVGVWSFNYKPTYHNTAAKYIFYNHDSAGSPTTPKTVPARFGAPWAGTLYGLYVPARTGTNGIQDGYDVIRHIANQPFTEEYISLKLCRLFVHDDFPNPSNDPSNGSYGFYNYGAGSLTPEADLVHQCMLAWENSNPKGQIRAVLNTIFNSDLFRRHDSSMQKIKTPLEYTVSAIRALRAAGNNGTFTATTDGYALVSPLSATALARMGSMFLFDRAAPDGYPEAGPPWISAGTLAERLRFVQALLHSTNVAGVSRPTDAGSNSSVDPVGLLKLKLPAGSWNDPGAVADYFLSILYPAEGRANLDLYRTAALNFLNTADNGVTLSPFNVLGNTSTAYDTRVRGMVAMLMTFQRFHEQ
jgi:uncharacterized protein (DUF1800 family)